MAQFARPSSEVDAGFWLPIPGGTTTAAIDEVTPNDATDYIASTEATGEWALSSVTDPNDNTGHILRIRARKSSSGGRTKTIQRELRQGSTTIQQSTAIPLADDGSWETITLNITEANAANITDYSDLRVVLTSGETGGGGPRDVHVTWVELEVPNAGPTTVQGTAAGDYTYSGDGTGQVSVQGSSTGSYSYSGTGAGQSTISGSAAATYAYSGASDGTITGSATGDYSYSDSVTGQIVGSASEVYDYAGAVSGLVTATGSAAGSYTYAGTAAGSAGNDVQGSASGSYGYSGSATGQLYDRPRNLVATAISSSQVDLTWDAFPGATGYDIERNSTVIETDWGSNSYSDTGLDPDTLYTYRVRAVV